QPNPAVDGEPLIHTGIFRVVLPLEKSDTAKPNDNVLQAIAGDQVRVVYLDELHRGEGVRQLLANARCLEGNVGGVRVTQAVITDAELRIQTKLKTANALTNIGNRYKEFGLKTNAMEKYEQALMVCEEVTKESQKLGGRMLEQSYVQIWKIYFEMDRLNLAAAMCARLQREFPSSGFVDDALLQLADVARKQGELNRAIGIYNRLVGMKTSQLRGEAQFGVAACFDQMADEAEARGITSVAQMRDKAFQEYKKVFDDFPESGRVGEAVAKMANYYYQQKDYSRAIDTFETVLAEHPDAKFLDVILFNYGRCLFRMGRKASAQARFDQLIGEFPESPLAPDAKRISEALSPAVASPSP
ncbi:MAG: tetratricopeptide repeat protein, partial [Pirellulaceae bacterium]